jgi:hypothetical protein
MLKKIIVLLLALAMAAVACATVSTNAGRNEYTATGGQTIFNYTFKIYASTDLDVYLTPSGQEPNDSTDLTTAYTVTGVGVDAGGSITLNSGATAGDLVTIVSSIPTSRTIDYQFNGDFRPDVVNNDFDRAVSLVKQLENTSINTLKYQNSLQGGAGVLPDPVAGNVIGYDGVGQLTNLLLGSDGNSWDGLTDLGDNSIGKGSDLVAHTSTADNVTEALAKKLPLAGGTMTGDIIVDDGTTYSPSITFTANGSGTTNELTNKATANFGIYTKPFGGAEVTSIAIADLNGRVQALGFQGASGFVLTSANMGTGNNLDADTVDGQEASEFAPLAGGAVAWINLDGSTATTPAGTTGIRDSLNITSVERTALGKFTVTMSTTMANATYIVAATAALNAAPTAAQFCNVTALNKTTTTFELWVADSNGSVFEDAVIIDAVVFGDLP